jgi:cytochrome c biogenesis protein CcmG/thiol:disulfide interchange protein DsbE
VTRAIVAALAAAALTGCAGSPSSEAGGAGATPRTATDSARAVEHTPVDVPGAASCADIPQAPAIGPAPEGLPGLRLACLTPGPDVDLAAVRGRPVLVNLWATWCGPCREEMPLLQSSSEQHAGAVQFLGVDTKDRPAAAAKFLTEVGVTYPNVVDPDGDLLAHLRLPGLPVTLLLDAEGNVVGKHIGQLKQASLDDLLARLP